MGSLILKDTKISINLTYTEISINLVKYHVFLNLFTFTRTVNNINCIAFNTD